MYQNSAQINFVGNDVVFTLSDYSYHIGPIEVNATSQGLPYDSSSIMQTYLPNFQKSGPHLRILPLHTTIKIIQRLSTLDKLHINILYCGGIRNHCNCSTKYFYPYHEL